MSATGKGVERPARMKRAERREHLLDVAADLVVEGGIDVVTMERVAIRAGVSKALGYAYFDNSDELLVALFEREMGAYDDRIARRVAAAEDFDGRIRATVEAMFEHVADRGELIGRLLSARRPATPLEGRQRERSDAVENYFAGMVVEEYGLPRRTALAAAAIYLAGSVGALELWLGQRASRREITDTFVAVVRGGIDELVARAVAAEGSSRATG